MKRFSVTDEDWSEYEGSQWINGDLIFPYTYMRDRLKWTIKVYRDANASCYDCGLYYEYNEEYPRELAISRKCKTHEEIDEFVNDCFKRVKSEYTKYLTGNQIYQNREDAEQQSKGGGDFIDCACSTSLCGQTFKSAMKINLFGYKPTNGMSTDVMTLKQRGLAVACANLSCGYYNPHTIDEYTDFSELENCLDLCRRAFKTIQDVQKHKFTPKYDLQSYNGAGKYGFNSYMNQYGATEKPASWNDGYNGREYEF